MPPRHDWPQTFVLLLNNNFNIKKGYLSIILFFSVIFNRPHFSVIKLQEDYRLTGPIAGNFMREVYLPPFSQAAN